LAVTKSWEEAQELGTSVTAGKPRVKRRKLTFPGAMWLLAASLVVACGLETVYSAKIYREHEPGTPQTAPLNLNTVKSVDEITPYLQFYPSPEQRDHVAQGLFDYLERHRPLPNIGALAKMWRTLQAGQSTHLPLARLKPLWIVRSEADFRRDFKRWIAIYFASFWVVYLAWRLRHFDCDPAILPAVHILSGLGLILMISLRDPLRDTEEFAKFSKGVAIGAIFLFLPLVRAFDYRRLARLTYLPLLAAFALFAGLLRFGSGPGESDARVNLGPFQPVEFIKLLLALFLAGYFASKWERLRDLREKRFLRFLNLPRIEHAAPVFVAVSIGLAMFFVLKDLGPALVTGFLFLTLFALARGRAGLAVLGVVLLVGGVIVGYHIGQPKTVVQRIAMWLGPWDNNIHGGNQLAHGLWALSSGGAFGSGAGYGDPAMIPAGDTDLVLPSIGEEWGFMGVAAIGLLFAFLASRGLRAALRARTEYGFFLAAGLTTLLMLEMLLISGGVLGAVPLSGVVSPFLSSGNSAMLANFIILALILAISADAYKSQAETPTPYSGKPQAKPDCSVRELATMSPCRMTSGTLANSLPHEPAKGLLHRILRGPRRFRLLVGQDPSPFRKPVIVLQCALGICCVALLWKAADYQVFHDRDYLSRDARVFEDDGVKRAQHNPRLNSLAHEIQRGDILDRNGMLLATSDWRKIESRRAEFEKLNVPVEQNVARLDGRYYPLGSETAQLLGDWRTAENFHASNTSFIERDSNTKLQGYADYAELAPLIRYRHAPGNAEIERLRNRDRNVRTSLDTRLQLAASEILRAHLNKAHLEHGAIVVMDTHTGGIMAMVDAPEPSFTAPAQAPHHSTDELLDRARYGTYPPGSTFKLVTAMAALRLDPENANQTYYCRRLPDGRVGALIPGWNRPVHDDDKDHAHGGLQMRRAIIVSCNGYFAQLGVYKVGTKALAETAKLLEISTGPEKNLHKFLPFAAYGQGEVLVTPFKMARIAATIANDGLMPQGRWVDDASDERTSGMRRVIDSDAAHFLADAMRGVVVEGTGRYAMQGIDFPVTGKTGTAQLDAGEPHSWFIGYAPAGPAPLNQPQIAFAVLVEHGGYGGSMAAPIAHDLLLAAEKLGYFHTTTNQGVQQHP
jgi:cell division protein FtsI/penicillin-binding protein 2/cell division protein FtsW (lipid II flippase)